jgi:hypothetical protein
MGVRSGDLGGHGMQSPRPIQLPRNVWFRYRITHIGYLWRRSVLIVLANHTVCIQLWNKKVLQDNEAGLHVACNSSLS